MSLHRVNRLKFENNKRVLTPERFFVILIEIEGEINEDINQTSNRL